MLSYLYRFIVAGTILSWMVLIGLSGYVLYGVKSVEQSETAPARMGSIQPFELPDSEGNMRSPDAYPERILLLQFVSSRESSFSDAHERALKQSLQHRYAPVHILSFFVDTGPEEADRLSKIKNQRAVIHENRDLLAAGSLDPSRSPLPRETGDDSFGPLPPSTPEHFLPPSPHLVLVDMNGQIRGVYNAKNNRERRRLQKDLTYLTWEHKVTYRPGGDVLGLIPIAYLPEVNSGLNLIAGLFLLIGLIFAINHYRRAHIWTMVAALLCSSLFLIFYLTYHYHHGTTPFPGRENMSYFYYGTLLSHSMVAALLPFAAGTLIYFGYTEQLQIHRPLGRWILPFWLYVSSTGVIIYIMLYRYYPALPLH